MLSEDFIKKYLVKNPPTRKFYKTAIEKKEELEILFCNEYPEKLLDLARPNEEAQYKEYRKAIYQSPVKGYADRVVTTIKKIQKAQDWHEVWNDSAKTGDENIFDYTQKNYPVFGSLENWLFSIGIDQMVVDSNGVFAILPLPKLGISDQEYLRPTIEFYESDRVIDFKQNEYCVLLSNEKSLVKKGGITVREGKIYIFIDTESVIVAEQNGDADNENPTFQVAASDDGSLLPFVHNFGTMPAFMAGGVVSEYEDGNILNESFLSSCVPSWNESIRRYSDYQVCMVLKIYPKEWEIADVECGICRGTGRLNGGGACHKCNGVGSRTAKGPFGTIQVKAAVKTGVNEAVAIPTPPGGIIERDIEAVRVLKEEYQDKLTEGLAAVYMDFLIPAVNSGIAKEYDRQEINSFLNVVAAHIINNILYPAYYYIAMWRYSAYMSVQEIYDILPSINIPKKFDYITSFMAESKLTAAINNKFGAQIINELKINYMKNELGQDSTVLKKMETEFMLDPLPNRSEDDKMVELANKGCTLEDYILSTKLETFINKAVDENDGFLDMNYAEKNKIISAYVKAQMLSASAAVIPIVGADGSAPGTIN